MDKTKADILRVQSAAEVLRWMQRNPELADAEVAEHFNELARGEFQEHITKTWGEYDPDMHYDFL